MTDVGGLGDFRVPGVVHEAPTPPPVAPLIVHRVLWQTPLILTTGLRPGMAWVGGKNGYRTPIRDPAAVKPAPPPIRLTIYRERTGVCPKCPREGAQTPRTDEVGVCYPGSYLALTLPLMECEVCEAKWVEGDTKGLLKPVARKTGE